MAHNFLNNILLSHIIAFSEMLKQRLHSVENQSVIYNIIKSHVEKKHNFTIGHNFVRELQDIMQVVLLENDEIVKNPNINSQKKLIELNKLVISDALSYINHAIEKQNLSNELPMPERAQPSTEPNIESDAFERYQQTYNTSLQNMDTPPDINFQDDEDLKISNEEMKERMKRLIEMRTLDEPPPEKKEDVKSFIPEKKEEKGNNSTLIKNYIQKLNQKIEKEAPHDTNLEDIRAFIKNELKIFGQNILKEKSNIIRILVNSKSRKSNFVESNNYIISLDKIQMQMIVDDHFEYIKKDNIQNIKNVFINNVKIPRSIYNIRQSNNSFYILEDINAEDRKLIQLPLGKYNTKQLLKVLRSKINEQVGNLITIEFDDIIRKIKIKVLQDENKKDISFKNLLEEVIIDFSCKNSLAKTLGFQEVMYSGCEEYMAENTLSTEHEYTNDNLTLSIGSSRNLNFITHSSIFKTNNIIEDDNTFYNSKKKSIIVNNIPYIDLTNGLYIKLLESHNKEIFYENDNLDHSFTINIVI